MALSPVEASRVNCPVLFSVRGEVEDNACTVEASNTAVDPETVVAPE